jgi:hypothetical protein
MFCQDGGDLCSFNPRYASQWKGLKAPASALYVKILRRANQPAPDKSKHITMQFRLQKGHIEETKTQCTKIQKKGIITFHIHPSIRFLLRRNDMNRCRTDDNALTMAS